MLGCIVVDSRQDFDPHKADCLIGGTEKKQIPNKITNNIKCQYEVRRGKHKGSILESNGQGKPFSKTWPTGRVKSHQAGGHSAGHCREREQGPACVRLRKKAGCVASMRSEYEGRWLDTRPGGT